MTKFVLTRLFQLVVVVLVVTFVTSVVMSFLPGDPVKVIAPFADNQQREAIRADLHLDDPVPVRYVKWLGGFVTGDLGNYYTVSSTRPVADRFWPALRTSAILMLWAQFLALAMAVPAAIWSASHEEVSRTAPSPTPHARRCPYPGLRSPCYLPTGWA